MIFSISLFGHIFPVLNNAVLNMRYIHHFFFFGLYPVLESVVVHFQGI
jgi:hypothetical protein